jgi:hypothetical protein
MEENELQKAEDWYNDLHPAVNIYLSKKYNIKVPFIPNDTLVKIYQSEHPTTKNEKKMLFTVGNILEAIAKAYKAGSENRVYDMKLEDTIIKSLKK